MKRSSPRKLVLDAWALLALIQGEEPAASRVLEVLGEAEQKRVQLFVSWISLGEIYYIIGRQRGQAAGRETLDEVLLLPIRVRAVTKNDILAAAEYKMKYAISYADAFVLALAQSLEGVILTGDPEIINAEHGVTVERLERHGTL